VHDGASEAVLAVVEEANGKWGRTTRRGAGEARGSAA
jgi:hypothetical protein